MKAVIDTNVFLSALINRSGAPSKLRKRWLDGQFILVTSPAIEFEYADVLLHSPVVPAGEVFDLLDEIKRLSLVVPIAGTLTVCKDSDDDVFLETAIVGSADFLITKNLKHFPRKLYRDVRIVTVATFLGELEKIYP